MCYDFPRSHLAWMLFIHRLTAIKMIDIVLKIGRFSVCAAAWQHEMFRTCFDKHQAMNYCMRVSQSESE